MATRPRVDVLEEFRAPFLFSFSFIFIFLFFFSVFLMSLFQKCLTVLVTRSDQNRVFSSIFVGGGRGETSGADGHCSFGSGRPTGILRGSYGQAWKRVSKSRNVHLRTDPWGTP